MSHHTISEESIRMDWRDRIINDPEILLGKPVVKGTRISFELILGWLANGWTFDTIADGVSAYHARRHPGRAGLRSGDAARRTVHRQIQSLCVKPALIVSENFPYPAVLRLREAGIDVTAVREIMPGASDEAILKEACDTVRWLVTFDRDYDELVYVRRCPAPPAILYLRQEPCPVDGPAAWLPALLDDPALAIGQLVVIGERTIRCRPLPVDTQ